MRSLPEIIISSIGMLFGLGLLVSLWLDFDLANNGVALRGQVLEQWQTRAKSKQMVGHARVEFVYAGSKYTVNANAPLETTTDLPLIVSPLYPYYCVMGEQKPEVPSTGSAIIKGLLGLVFSAVGLATCLRSIRRFRRRGTHLA